MLDSPNSKSESNIITKDSPFSENNSLMSDDERAIAQGHLPDHKELYLFENHVMTKIDKTFNDLEAMIDSEILEMSVGEFIGRCLSSGDIDSQEEHISSATKSSQFKRPSRTVKNVAPNSSNTSTVTEGERTVPATPKFHPGLPETPWEVSNTGRRIRRKPVRFVNEAVPITASAVIRRQDETAVAPTPSIRITLSAIPSTTVVAVKQPNFSSNIENMQPLNIKPDTKNSNVIYAPSFAIDIGDGETVTLDKSNAKEVENTLRKRGIPMTSLSGVFQQATNYLSDLGSIIFGRSNASNRTGNKGRTKK